MKYTFLLEFLIFIYDRIIRSRNDHIILFSHVNAVSSNTFVDDWPSGTNTLLSQTLNGVNKNTAGEGGRGASDISAHGVFDEHGREAGPFKCFKTSAAALIGRNSGGKFWGASVPSFKYLRLCALRRIHRAHHVRGDRNLALQKLFQILCHFVTRNPDHPVCARADVPEKMKII